MGRLWMRPVYGSERDGDGRWEMDGGEWGIATGGRVAQRRGAGISQQ